MSRKYSSIAIGALIFLVANGAAYGTPILGGIPATMPLFSHHDSGPYISSLSQAGTQQHSATSGNGSSIRYEITPHQFAFIVPVPPSDPPPPRLSETPEPSTLTLFGSGLIIFGAAVRRKLRR